jgi:hypothetical protein
MENPTEETDNNSVQDDSELGPKRTIKKWTPEEVS